MFEDVGKKIKKIAKGYFVASIILGFIIAIVLFVIAANSHDEVLWIISGLATMVIIPFVAWLSSLILYGFGEIVDTAIINRGKMPVITTTNTVQPTAVSPAVSEKKAKESNAVAIIVIVVIGFKFDKVILQRW